MLAWWRIYVAKFIKLNRYACLDLSLHSFDIEKFKNITMRTFQWLIKMSLFYYNCNNNCQPSQRHALPPRGRNQH
jgi:hypothetical protein